jgi:hypothetical protein
MRSNYSRLMIPAESDVTIPPDTLLMQVSRPCSQSVSPTTSNDGVESILQYKYNMYQFLHSALHNMA